MIHVPKRCAGLAVAVLAALSLAACSSSSSTTTGTTTATPKSGGTLKIIGSGGPDHIDTVQAYYTVDYELERLYTRQLVQYPGKAYTKIGDSGWTADTTVAADAATVVPTTANGGISSDGKTYTFHINTGVDWSSTPARQVTSQDFLREFKAFCNPVSPVGNPGYYESTITGLKTYCDAETTYFTSTKKYKAPAPTAANIAAYQNAHSITGITTPDSSTLVFTLSQPASDFLDMLAMPFTSARPVEYDSYVPNSLQLGQNTLSDGPYKITSYEPGKSITLARNGSWKQSSDTLRHAYVNAVDITLGVTSAQTQLSDVQSGQYDLVMGDVPLNPSSIESLAASNSSQFKIWDWSTTNPYFVFNLKSPNANKAMQNVMVRQAVELGLDKIAVIKAAGGPLMGGVLNTVIPPGNVGYQNSNLYPDNNGNGDVTACKAKLKAAGYPNGISLNFTYPDVSSIQRIFVAAQASLAQCGITLAGKPQPDASYYVDLGNGPSNNKAGTWDMGAAAWIPDWFGNNGRTVIQALFQGPNCVVNTVNYGCYDNATVNSLVTQAETASSTTAAATDWHAADLQIMKDAAIVPIESQKWAVYASTRVKGVGYQTAIFTPNIGLVDISNLYLASGS
jgi:peptide/nickel transport system substrate-binding protein